MLYLFLYLGVALILWPIFYGINLAYWQGKYFEIAKENYWGNVSTSLILAFLAALAWPLGWMLTIGNLGYGFRLK